MSPTLGFAPSRCVHSLEICQTSELWRQEETLCGCFVQVAQWLLSGPRVLQECAEVAILIFLVSFHPDSSCSGWLWPEAVCAWGEEQEGWEGTCSVESFSHSEDYGA